MVFIIAFIVFALIAVFIIPMFLGGFSANPDPEDFDRKSQRSSLPKSQKPQSDDDVYNEEWKEYYRGKNLSHSELQKISEIQKLISSGERWDTAAEYVMWEQEQESLHEYDNKGPAPKGM